MPLRTKIPGVRRTASAHQLGTQTIDSDRLGNGKPWVGSLPGLGSGQIHEVDIQQLYVTVSKILEGKLNNTQLVTLTPNVGSTVLVDPRITAQSVVIFSPMTANAAAEIGNGTIHVVLTGGTATFNHANNAQADRTFGVAVFG